MSRADTILGVDPGLARMGWGIVRVENGKLKVENYGVVETNSSDEISLRLAKLHSELKQLINTYQPTRAAVEKLFFGKNAKTAMIVGEARGVIILTLNQCGLEFQEFTPAEVKIALTGYGSADKVQMQRMTQQTLRLKELPKPDDAADALAVAVTAAVSRNF